METNPWKTLSTRAIYDNPWISVDEHQVLNPSGNPGIYGVVHFKNIAIGILPLDESGYTWLVGQYRYTLGQYSWEMPEGGGKADTPPLASAQRELQEETGIIASDWQEILRIHTSNSVTDELGIAYIARGLSFGNASPEETEQLQVKRLPFSEVVEMVIAGSITDAFTVCTVLKAWYLMQQGKL